MSRERGTPSDTDAGIVALLLLVVVAPVGFLYMHNAAGKDEKRKR